MREAYVKGWSVCVCVRICVVHVQGICVSCAGHDRVIVCMCMLVLANLCCSFVMSFHRVSWCAWLVLAAWLIMCVLARSV